MGTGHASLYGMQFAQMRKTVRTCSGSVAWASRRSTYVALLGGAISRTASTCSITSGSWRYRPAAAMERRSASASRFSRSRLLPGAAAGCCWLAARMCRRRCQTGAGRGVAGAPRCLIPAATAGGGRKGRLAVGHACPPARRQGRAGSTAAQGCHQAAHLVA